MPAFDPMTSQEEKARMREDEELRRADEARASRIVPTSAAMVRKLQRRRFGQVFEYLDSAACGFLDMASILEDPPECLEELDDDVRMDLETAAQLACRGSAIMTPRGRCAEGAAPEQVPVDPTKVPLDVFFALMEEAIALRPRPRAYLTPSAPQRYVPIESFAPVIDERSKQLAAKLRPKDTPLHELLYREANAMTAKKEALRAAVTGAVMSECTFAPKLVSEQIVPEGRIMRTVRQQQQAYGHSLNITILNEDSALEAATAAAAAACRTVDPSAAAAAAAAVAAGAPAPAGALAELKACLDAEAAAATGRSGAEQAAASSAGSAQDEADEAAGEYDGGSGPEDAPCEQGALAVEGSQFLELEREVEAMLEATSAAAAAAERLTSKSDQEYLSKILGLTQEAVDAMQPAMSSLPGWEVRGSRGGSSSVAPGEASPSAGGRIAPRCEPLDGAATATAAAPNKSLFSISATPSAEAEAPAPVAAESTSIPDMISFTSANDNLDGQ